MSRRTDPSGDIYSGEQADLFRQWVDHFGAIVARDLDLGTLTAIHEWVVDGLAPTNDETSE